MTYIPRAAEAAARRISDSFPVLVVTGARQVGKSTMLQHLAEADRTVVSLDDPNARALARTDPGLFLQRYRPPLLIDEIQYAPQLLPLIKLAVDRSGRDGQFWLTGSQSFHLMRHLSESLAGRAGVLPLLGLSSAEIERRPSQPFDPDPGKLVARLSQAAKPSLAQLYQRIITGSMPRLWAQPTVDRETYYRSYVATYLQRDIRDLAQVSDETVFLAFMTAVAARTARPLVMEELSRDVGVSAPTVKRWLSLLASSGLIVLVPPYRNNILSRLTKQPLLHLLDTGLAAHLLRWSDPETLERGAMSGQFFESHVFAELYKSFAAAGREPPLFYYRDKDKREIDVLICQDGAIHPLEIKKSAAPGASALKNFRALDPLAAPGPADLKVDLGAGGVLCLVDDVLPIDAKNSLIPAWLI
ncbi:MAG: ATP-binding protein [Propionibacteriaceae bacterium]|jgi:predicted AAA+ superfamily ATPase|nr:ATP-binding protein [Propionibacteriaceae bacterium]